MRLEGIVVRGHRVASGHAESCPYPGGSLAHQLPLFRAAGVPLEDNLYPGTLNLDLAPHTLDPRPPAYTVEAEWFPGVCETFWLNPLWVYWHGERLPGWQYAIDPATKAAHPQPSTVAEVLAPPLKGLVYGDAVEIAPRV